MLKDLFKNIKTTTDKRLELEKLMGKVYEVCADLIVVSMQVKDTEWTATLSEKQKITLKKCTKDFEKSAQNMIDANGTLQEKYFRFCAERPQEIQSVCEQYNATQIAINDAIKYSYLVSIKAGNTALPMVIKTIIDMYEGPKDATKHSPLFGFQGIDPKKSN